MTTSNIEKTLREKFETNFPLVGTDERDFDGKGTRDEVSDWWLKEINSLLDELLSEVATYQVDLCENSQEFKKHVFMIINNKKI